MDNIYPAQIAAMKSSVCIKTFITGKTLHSSHLVRVQIIHAYKSYFMYFVFFLTSITCGYCSFIAFNLWTLSNHHLWVFREQTLSQKHLFATTKTMRIERQFNIYSVFNSILWELEQGFQNVKPEGEKAPDPKTPLEFWGERNK